MDVNFASPASVKTKRPGQGEVYSQIVRVLVYAMAVLIPLVYLPFTGGVLEYNKQMILVVAMLAGLVLWLLGVVVSGKLTTRGSPMDKGVLAVLATVGVATVFSVMRAKSVFGLSVSSSSSLATVAGLSVFYFLAVNTLHDRGRMLRSALSLSVVIALLGGLMQMFGKYLLPGTFTHVPGFTTVGSLNALGILAAVCLPLLAKTTVRGSGRLYAGIAMAGVVLSLAALVVLNWWVLWTVAVAGMLAMIAFDSVNAGQVERFTLGRFAIPIAVVVIAAVALLTGLNLRAVKANFPVEVAPSYRLSWDVLKGALGQKFLYGYGPENFSLAFDTFGAGQLANTQLADTRFYDSTAEVMTVAVQGGALALLALGLLGWCLIQVIARFGTAISESVARGEPAAFVLESSGTLASAVALASAALLYPFNTTLAFLGYALITLAALIIADGRPRTVSIEEHPRYSLAASLGFITGLILVLTTLYFFTTMYLADVRYANALSAKTPQALSDGLMGAIALNPADDQYLRDASRAQLLVLRQELAAPAKAGDTEKTTRIQTLVSTAVQLAQGATQVAPLESLNWANLGDIYQAFSGTIDNVERPAEDAYRQAASLRPGDPTLDNRIGSMWLNRADQTRVPAQATDALTRAEEAFKRATEVSPNFGLAIYNLGAVYERQGKVTDAIRQLEKVAPYNTNNPTLMFELGLLYIRADRHPDAVAAMQRSVLVAPQYANARWYLALLLEERGDLDGALAQLEEVQKSNPDNAVLAQKITQLQGGRRAIPPAKVIDSKPLQ